jgi:hypothetical protein
MSTSIDQTAARLLAEVHAARGLMQRLKLRKEETIVRSSPTAADLWAHVRRKPGEVLSLKAERAIRNDPEVSQRYRTMLSAQALAHSSLAIAASDGTVRHRRLGPFTLEILPPDGAAMTLLLIRGVDEGTSTPSIIEAAFGANIVRLELVPPIAGTIVLALDPEVPETAMLACLVADPKSEIFLL